MRPSAHVDGTLSNLAALVWVLDFWTLLSSEICRRLPVRDLPLTSRHEASKIEERWFVTFICVVFFPLAILLFLADLLHLFHYFIGYPGNPAGFSLDFWMSIFLCYLKIIDRSIHTYYLSPPNRFRFRMSINQVIHWIFGDSKSYLFLDFSFGDSMGWFTLIPMIGISVSIGLEWFNLFFLCSLSQFVIFCCLLLTEYLMISIFSQKKKNFLEKCQIPAFFHFPKYFEGDEECEFAWISCVRFPYYNTYEEISDDQKKKFFSSLSSILSEKDRETTLQIVKCFGPAMAKMNSCFSEDEEILIAGLTQEIPLGCGHSGFDECYYMGAGASGKLISSEKMIRIAVRWHGSRALSAIRGSMYDDKEFLMNVLSDAKIDEITSIFHFCSLDLSDDKEFVLFVVKRDKNAFRFVRKRMKEDRDVWMASERRPDIKRMKVFDVYFKFLELDLVTRI